MTIYKPVVNFVFSRPYESSLLAIKNEHLTKEHTEKALKIKDLAQKIWAAHEEKASKLFEEIYDIKITEETIDAFITFVSPRSYSQPLTITFFHYKEFETNEVQQNFFVFTLIHELAHYFAYTRPKESYFQKLFEKALKLDLLKSHGANLHFLIQAVEFGIGAEVLGESVAAKIRYHVAEKRSGEYKISAQALIDNKVPLNKSCLRFIEENILE